VILISESTSFDFFGDDEPEKEPERIVPEPTPEPPAPKPTVAEQHIIEGDVEEVDVKPQRQLRTDVENFTNDRPAKIEGDQNLSRHERERMRVVESKIRKTTLLEDIKDFATKAPPIGVKRMEFGAAVARGLNRITEENLERPAGAGMTRRESEIFSLQARQRQKYQTDLREFANQYAKEYGEMPVGKAFTDFQNAWLVANQDSLTLDLLNAAKSIPGMPQHLERGLIGDAIVTTGEFAVPMIINGFSAPTGALTIFGSITGASLEKNLMMQEQLNMSNPQAAYEAAIYEGMMSSPVEFMDQVLKVKLIGGMAKGVLRKAGVEIAVKPLEKFFSGLVRNKVLKVAGATALPGIFGVAEETVQEEIGLMSSIMALNPDASQESQRAKYHELRNTDWFKDQREQAAKIGGVAGLIFGGVPGNISALMSSKAEMDRFITDEQREANQNQAVIDTTDLKAADSADLENKDQLVSTDGNGTIVISTNKEREANQAKAEVKESDTAKESTRVTSLLDTDNSVSVNKRSPQMSENQEQHSREKSEVGQKQFEETRAAMEKELNSTDAAQEIERFARADVQFLAAIEAGDFDTAGIVVQQMGQSAQKIGDNYTKVIAAREKELGDTAEVSPEMVEALTQDAADREARVEHFQQALQGAEQKSQAEANQDLIDKLSNPNTIKQTLIDAEVKARNTGDSENAKLYTKVVKELNLRENKGDIEYLKGANLNKLIDIKSDIEQSIAGMGRETPMEQQVIALNMLDNITDAVYEKRDFDVSEEALDIQEAEAKEAAQEAKKAATEKAKKAPAPTPLKKLVKKAEAKKAAVKPKKKAPSKLQKAVQRQRTREKAARQQKERSRLATLAQKAREKKARVSPKGAVNVFKFSDGTTLEGATSGEIFEKASPAQKKEMEAGTAIEGFTKAGKFEPRKRDVKVSDLQKEDRTFGIITAENPAGKPASKLANRQAMNKLKAKLSGFGLPVVEVKGKFGVDETSFVVEGISQADLTKLGKEFGQQSVIHMEGGKATYLEGTKAVDVVDRKKITEASDATDFFTELAGKKFQIPFFQDIAQKMEDASIILDLSSLRAQGQDFLSMVDNFARHIKMGKNAWLHKIAKKKGAQYHFVNGEKGLADNERFRRLPPKHQESVIQDFNDTIGIFVGSASQGFNDIFMNMNTILNDVTSLRKAFEAVDHEALHSVVTSTFGRSNEATRRTIKKELESLWNSIPPQMMKINFTISRDKPGWEIGNLFVEQDPDGKGEAMVNDLRTGFRQILGNPDELVTYAFTSPGMAQWLHSIPSDFDVVKPFPKSMWGKLKEIITRRILGIRTKLDDVQFIMDQNLHRVKGDVRHSVSKKKVKGLSKTRTNLTLKPLQAKAPNAAKSNAVATEAELPKHLQLSPEAKAEGAVIESVYDPETDTVHFVAENLQDEAHILRKWLHENVGHKGLRDLFGDNAKFERFLLEAWGIGRKNEKSNEQLGELAALYFNTDLKGLTLKQQHVTTEEWLARYWAEPMDLKVRKGLLQKFTDFIKAWLPKRFLDLPALRKGETLTEQDLMTVMEAAKTHILDRNKKIKSEIDKAFRAREPRQPSSISKMKFVRNARGYAKLAKEVMATFPEAKNWYTSHMNKLEGLMGRDSVIFNMLLSITSPRAKVTDNVAHAVATYSYMLGKRSMPSGAFPNVIKDRVDSWNDEQAIIDNIGKQYKVNEFIRGLLGDPNATVLDIWMHRLFYGQDYKAPGKEAFTTVPAAAGRQMLFDISKILEADTGEVWSPRDTQAVLWTWIKAKQEGIAFDKVPNYDMGFNSPSSITDGKTPLEFLKDKFGEDLINAPLSTMLQIEGFENTDISRLEKKRRLQLSKLPSQARLTPVTPKDAPVLRLENEDGTAWVEINGKDFEFEFDQALEQGIGTEIVAHAVKSGANRTRVMKKNWYLREPLFDMGFAETETYPDGSVEYTMPEWVIDSYRDNRGIISTARLKAAVGGTLEDIEPRRAHQYSLAKIAYADDLESDSQSVMSDNDKHSFLNKLWEWKDQADLNIQREVNRLEQDFLVSFGGKKVVGGIISSGKFKNTAKTRLLQKAMNLYIDSGVGSNLEKVMGHKKHLEGKKRTNRESDRLAIINRMLEMTESEKEWADANIRSWYNELFQYAKDNDILDTFVEGYVRRAWSIPKDHDVTGAVNTSQNAGSFSNFALTTPRAKKRQFQSIIDGWNEGTDWNLKNDAVLTNIHNYMNEINEVFTNRRFINDMKGMVNTEGESLIEEDMSDKDARARGFVQLKARGFGTPFQPMWARKDLASILNKVTEQGVSDLWSTPGIQAIQKINAIVKGTILSLSAFHHMAGLRSWSFGVKKGIKHNGVRAYKRGLDKIENQTELQDVGYKLGPIADFMIKHGLTIGKIQDWDQNVLAAEKSVIEGVLANRKGAVSRALLNIKRAGRHARENWTRALFGRLFAGLKVEAASVEMAHAISAAERKKGEALTDAELAEEARKVSRLINADFGGLHLKRMGRNPNLQKVAQLLLLAPDWTESNFRTVTGMIPGMNKWINKMIGDFPAPEGMGKVYRKFWFGIGVRLLGAYALAYAMTYGVADDEDKDQIENLLKSTFSSYDDFKRARWTAIPLDPWLNRFKEEQSKEREKWRGFRLGGHFFDILKVMEPTKLIKHKASPMIRTITNLGTGTDWRGAPYTSAAELMATGKLVSESTFEKERDFFARLPSQVLYEARGAMPIWTQEMLRLISGETSALEASRAAGVDIRPLTLPNPEKREFTEIKSEVNKLEREMKEARRTRNSDLIQETKQKQREYPNYNRTKSRLGYSNGLLKSINRQLKPLELKQKQGIELTILEQKKLKRLKERKQNVYVRFLELIKG
jgi:hypothetical protein